MPALVNSRFGASGRRLDDGTIVCCFDLKKSRKSCRTWVLGRISLLAIRKSKLNKDSGRRATAEWKKHRVNIASLRLCSSSQSNAESRRTRQRMASGSFLQSAEI